MSISTWVSYWGIAETLKKVCVDIEARNYGIRFVEIGMEEDNVHMLVQGIPTLPVSNMVKIIKSITAREIFKQYPYIRKEIL